MRQFNAEESAIILEALDHEAHQENFNQADVLALIDKVKSLCTLPEAVIVTPPLHSSGRTWRNQFQIDEDHPLHVPEFLLRAPWEDTSWGNDAYPSFWDRERKLKVWVEYDLIEHRENDDAPKYCVERVDDEGNWIGLEDSNYGTDSVEELEKHLDVFLTDLDLEAIDTITGTAAQGDCIINDLGQALSDVAKALVTARRASNMIGFHVLTNRLSVMEGILDIILSFDTFYCVNCGTLGFKKTGKNTAEGWYCTPSCHALSTDH